MDMETTAKSLPTGSRIEYFKRGFLNPKWYFRFVAPNNEIIGQSQGYKSKVNMLVTVDTYFWNWDTMLNQRR